MGFERVSKPFLETWLRRTRKQLSGSGRISELALILARDLPHLSQDEWRVKLQAIYQGDEEPDLELLTQIDSLLAKPSGKHSSGDTDALLF
jgi:hypothetical protein